MTTDSIADRAALIAGLRGLADFLAEHPDVPVPPAWHETRVLYIPDGDTDDERRAGVDAAARALGTTAGDPDGYGHYETERRFGPVTYGALAISEQRRAAYAAWSSYSGSVSPDDTSVAA